MPVKRWLGLAAWACLGPAGLWSPAFAGSAPGEAAEVTEEEEIVFPEIPPEAAHPLDPLSRAEIDEAVALLTATGKLPEQPIFATIVLHEPPKSEVLGFEPGSPMKRRAYVTVIDLPANKTFGSIVDLSADKVLSYRHLPGAQPAITDDEYVMAEEAIRKSAQFESAMTQRGLKLDDVHMDIWARGDQLEEDPTNARIVKAFPFLKAGANHPYARPIEGVMAICNLNTLTVSVIDTGTVAIPKNAEDYLTPEGLGPQRPAAKPLVVSSPEGPAYAITGQHIRWEKWQMRYAVHPRDGLVLYKVSYEDGGKLRPILYRGSLSEMVVPYGDPKPTWNPKNAFDVGEYGLGRLSNSMQLGAHVPANATLVDVVFANNTGEAYVQPAAVAIYERDGGLMWSHYDYISGKNETRRARELVLSHIVTIGNYDYALNWIFSQDGSIKVEADLTGMLLVQGVNSSGCSRCQAIVDGEKTVTGEGKDDRFGVQVGENLVAVFHQHFFNFRLDFDVDGQPNSVMELNVKSGSPGEQNPLGNMFYLEETVLPTEKSAMRHVNMASHRTWRVFNPNERTSLGHFPGFVLEPATNAFPFSQPDSPLRRRAGFITHHLWVTQFKQDELYAAGWFPNQGKTGAGLPNYVADNQPISNEDVVLWYTFGVTHVPRPEEWPVMPVARAGFKLVPKGFFTRSPAMDVPPATPPAAEESAEKMVDAAAAAE